MNLGGILGALISSQNVYAVIVQILTLVAGFLAGLDSDKKGPDDLAAGTMLAVADGIAAYGEKNDNDLGNILDGVIAALVKFRAEAVALGLVYPVDSAGASAGKLSKR